MRIDPNAHDPGRWGHSVVNLAELIVPLLDAVGARNVLEVGAYAGDLTGLLLEWAGRVDATVTAIDPAPQPALEAMAEQRPDLELVRETSVEALAHLPLGNVVVVVDGDHNYYTVSEELQLVAKRTEGGLMPLVILHDVSWPHARRDAYYTPELIPDEYRQPIVQNGGVFPGDAGIREGALPYRHVAAREGGPQNGVLTAVENFVAGRAGLRFALVPAFFGLGVIWQIDAPWSDAVAAIVDPWDRNPLLARLEANRVYHLASMHVEKVNVTRERERNHRRNLLLLKLLESKSFSLAERISRLRQGGQPAISKDDVRRALFEGSEPEA
jgi:Methyltransferase domain